MSVAVGLRVMAEMMTDELTVKVGAKHAKLPARRRLARHRGRIGGAGRPACAGRSASSTHQDGW